jgi:SAM-dependent methyltransferase
MAMNTICNLCEAPGTYAEATDVATVPCPLRRFAQDTFTVWRCKNCASLHCKEEPALVPYYRGYPRHEGQIDPGTRITLNNRLRLLKKRGLKPDSRILDFGCGGGAFVEFLKQRGYPNTVGYDAFVEKFSDRSVLSGRYDAVVSYDVIEHFDDTHEYLATTANLLDVGGLAVIGTPNADHVSLQTRPFVTELHQPYHRHILSERVLMSLAREFGFEAEHTLRRLYIDSLVPGLNTRFLWAYLDEFGGVIDPAFEPPRADIVLRSPRLVFFAFFGYFMPPKSNILVSFRKQRHVQSSPTRSRTTQPTNSVTAT